MSHPYERTQNTFTFSAMDAAVIVHALQVGIDKFRTMEQLTRDESKSYFSIRDADEYVERVNITQDLIDQISKQFFPAL